ncbi:hypothetical protein [Phytohabitans rumicis]|uniref:Uncharacterized protein n=1 Tax=Phytohabitans rumicis TaxID=1076125 RepID=A0A6V8L7W9_9ACTN|nr:hypothetical protein [Phytohabitans rumicis]GFJ93353.1 hypothetical protein Prum_069950 [Phytohabitans rumicis]
MPRTHQPTPDRNSADTGNEATRVPAGTGWPTDPPTAPPPGRATGTGWPTNPPEEKEHPDV